MALLNSFYTAFEFLPAAESSPTSSRTSFISPPQTAKTNSNSNSSKNGNGTERRRRKSSHISTSDKFNDWSLVKLLEQHETRHLKTATQPYAYVGDFITPIHLAHSITQEMEAYEARKAEDILALCAAASTPQNRSRSPTFGIKPKKASSASGEESIEKTTKVLTPEEEAREARIQKMNTQDFQRRKRRVGWLEKLRDCLEAKAEVGWFVVVCEDEVRAVYEEAWEAELDSELIAGVREVEPDRSRADGSEVEHCQTARVGNGDREMVAAPSVGGLKRLFQRKSNGGGGIRSRKCCSAV